jgi:ATP-dependent DNA helicase RecG
MGQMTTSDRAKSHPHAAGEELLVLPGIGPARARSLAEAGLATLEDLLWWLPFRYEDRRNPVQLVTLQPGVTACVRVRVMAIKESRTFRKGLHVTEAIVSDETGNVHVVWFNQPWLPGILTAGTEAYLYGKTELFSTRRGLRLQMDNPEVERAPGPGEETVHADRIVPIYRKAGPLAGKVLRTLQHHALELRRAGDEILPRLVLGEEGWPPRKVALREVHFPSEECSIEDLSLVRTPAQRRLVFEEFLGLQWSLAQTRRDREQRRGVVIRPSRRTGDLLRTILPFRLTPAQRRALKEIADDMGAPSPMYRLLHGDVGSGKTIVAFLAMIAAAKEFFQAAFMAPTEVLASQQWQKLSRLLEGTGLRAALLTSSVKGKQRKAVLESLARGEVHLVVGTHSLFQEKVEYANLGLAVIDEQHRFGVEQRASLVAKGESPNVLVMTATPIPRSLAMTLYGDLDLSVLDQMPPGRIPVVTAIRDESARHRVEAFLRKEMDGGRQVFVVFPLVEESEALDVRAAVQAFERFNAGPFRGYPCALLHGKLSAKEKDAVMAAVRSGEVRLLVATTVVEVGVDLPEASTMVIEHADRFGLAQLHQLRGRVGRGGQKGYCILMRSEGSGADSLERLRVLEATTDGFEIAEADLRFRGPGDPAGVRQWGGGRFRIANPLRDFGILQKARRWASRLSEPDFPWTAGEKERFLKWAEHWQSRWGSYGRIG